MCGVRGDAGRHLVPPPGPPQLHLVQRPEQLRRLHVQVAHSCRGRAALPGRHKGRVVLQQATLPPVL